MEECKNQEGLTRINPKREDWITEAAHITLLDQPHNGPDVESNILCFCPNHHVLFDNGGFSIADDLKLIGIDIDSELKTVKNHKIELEFIQYHREHYQVKN
tara:strand:+ start:17 stop:319 length:303 start_codon:yes stop_codon:yes gene_type:complete